MQFAPRTFLQSGGNRLIPFLSLIAVGFTSLEGRPINGIHVETNCFVCHGQSIAEQPSDVPDGQITDGRYVTGKLRVSSTGMKIDLENQLDGEIRGALQAIQAAAGSTVSLRVDQLDGDDAHAVQIKGFEGPGQLNSLANALVWSDGNPEGSIWNRREDPSAPYFDTDVQGGESPKTYTFDLALDEATPGDIYDLTFAVAGLDGTGLFYEEEHFYVQVTAAGGDIPAGPDDKFSNLSTRGSLGSTETLTPGFVIDGTLPRQVLIRVIGPTLAEFGLTTACPDPSLLLFKQGDTDPIGANSKWGDASNATQIKSVGSIIGAYPFPDDSLDAALLITLQPGAYTVQADCGDGGEVVAEVYDASGAN